MIPKHAVIYARYSPRPAKKDADGADIACESCSMQIELCRAYCASMQWLIVGQYRDDDASGATVDREGWKQAFEHAIREKATLVIYSMSRMIRNTEEGCVIERQLRKAGCGIASLRDHIDTSNATGRFVFRIMLATDEFERERAAERTSDSHKLKQARGGRVGSKPPYGWTTDPENGKRLVEDSDEQRLLAEILSLDAQGLGPQVIAKKLTREGKPARGGKPWSHVVITGIIRLAAERLRTGRPI